MSIKKKGLNYKYYMNYHSENTIMLSAEGRATLDLSRLQISMVPILKVHKAPIFKVLPETAQNKHLDGLNINPHQVFH